MRPPTVALIYPLQRKLTRPSTNNETKLSSLSCNHLREQYNKCILSNPYNCKDIGEIILIKCKPTP
jgi:hypothetical protein